MSNRLGIIFVVISLISSVIIQSSYIINERMHGIELMFGKVHNVRKAPGLYFKLPFIQEVVRVDKRLLNVNIYDLQITSSNAERMIISAFAKVRITDVEKFYVKLNNDKNKMNNRCKSIIEFTMRNVMGKFTLNDLLSEKRLLVTKKILISISKQLHEFGVDVVDFRIMRSDLPEKNHNAIIKQMISERQKEAELIRSEGRENYRKIKSSADKERSFLEAEAYEKSQRIRAEGDKIAAMIYNKAYSQNKEFYLFLRSLESYRRSFKEDKVFILNPSNQYLKDLKIN